MYALGLIISISHTFLCIIIEWSVTSPEYTSVKRLGQQNILVQWRIPSVLSNEIEGFFLTVTLSGRNDRIVSSVRVTSVVRAFLINRLRPRKTYSISLQMIRQGVLSASATTVKRL